VGRLARAAQEFHGRFDMKASRIALPLLALLGGGCMTGPRPVGFAPGEYLSANQPGQAWITLTSGTEMIVTGPRVITDTVFGWTADGQEMMIAVSDIREVRARKLDAFRTALIPATVVVGTAAVLLLVSNDGSEAPQSYAECLEVQEEDC
jgi:hypothetical protein